MQGDYSFPVAAIQMVSGSSVQSNLTRAAELIRKAAEQGARLVVLPEYFCFMGRNDSDKLAIQETPGGGPIQEFLAASAQRHGIWLLGGTLPLQSEDTGRIYNAMPVFDSDGRQVTRYEKNPPFQFS